MPTRSFAPWPTSLGFELLGITDASVMHDDLARLQAWCDRGDGGELAYMTRNPPRAAADPRTLQRSVQTIVSVAVPYVGDGAAFEHEHRYGRVARYAWGRDYHDVVLPRLKMLAKRCTDALWRLEGACGV